ncbi:Oxidoreductase-related protein [Gaiella occulta]|uniref:Oxidoreductase-related protein n=1 Tax=Gaiella occulta TaxID=1002870 RepID=A0A7M2YYC0_9ACTN|nr:Gfo/Idh/MocA family oxidoreductase [Gaiella occulta]RDI74730.1 Oxidoreductase-related protein [Gaiella occulta]
MSLGIGVLGCGSVFAGPYAGMIDRLHAHGRVHVAAVYDVDDRKRRGAAGRYDVEPDLAGPGALISRDDVDVVLVLTSMNEHGPLSRAALEAGKHVLVEKPLATSLEEASALVELAKTAPGLLVCAPHVLLSPTFRAIHACVREGRIGRLLSGRARYGWAGPWWADWFYRPGGGSLFDLGVYNVTTLCALFGPARRVTAMVGTAIPERDVSGRVIPVEADDNAHVLLDFGDARFAVVSTGFTMQRYRSPAVELYGSEGTAQLLGDDWAPEGWELWRNEEASWRLMPEADPHWQWTDGLRHLVDCVEAGVPTATRPEHALHALEIMLAAQAAGRDGVARQIRTGFPEPVYDGAMLAAEEAHRSHDRRSHDGI